MSAELPRCATCRSTIKPGELITFRSDGRVEHVECPPVVCSVCDHSIRPTDPIRRDGDTMFHGNCWLRRARVVARPLAGGADVAAVIRAKLAEGALPRTPGTKVWGSTANGASCMGCGEAIRGTEYEVEFAGAVSVRFHRTCYGIWDHERLQKSPPAISGGSAASPLTTVLRNRVFGLAAQDIDELLTVGAEILTAARNIRATSRTLSSLSAVLIGRSTAVGHTALASC